MKKLIKLCTTILLLLSFNGCMTFSGEKLADLEPITPKISPYIKVSVGDFSAQLDDSKELTDNEAGRIINDEIMKNWKDNNYISGFIHANDDKLSPDAQYKLQLKGHQQDTSSSLMQAISAITFLLIPAKTESSYDLSYELENLQTEKKYTMQVSDTISTTTWLLFFPALPFQSIGANNTYERFAEHVYQGFVEQGAFSNQEDINTPPK